MKGDGIPPHPGLSPLLPRKDFLDEVLTYLSTITVGKSVDGNQVTGLKQRNFE